LPEWDDGTLFEYVHPDPWALLPTIRILEDRGSDDEYEVQIHWGHGCGWCNATSMFTRLISREFQELYHAPL